MTNLRLEPGQLGELAGLLRAAFRPERFVEFLLYRVEKDVADLSSPNDDYPAVLRKVLQLANAGLWLGRLLEEARKAVPEDPGLRAFAETCGLVSPPVDASKKGHPSLTGRDLELKIVDSQSTYDIATWRRRLGEIEGRVCRIEYPATKGRGTGVLIGKNAVLTNYHVIEPVKNAHYQPSQVVLRFDYKVENDGITVSAGVPYSLASEWLYSSSPYSAYDLEPHPLGEPAPDELDFAILRISGNPADDPVGGATNDPKPVARQWLVPSATAHDFVAQPALYIVQHPDGRPMQIAIDSHAVIGVNGNGTRVRYTTTTEPGSSGSPCFGADWEWVALHHSGDPAYAKLMVKPSFNEGIPLPIILGLLRSRGQERAFGGLI